MSTEYRVKVWDDDESKYEILTLRPGIRIRGAHVEEHGHVWKNWKPFDSWTSGTRSLPPSQDYPQINKENKKMSRIKKSLRSFMLMASLYVLTKIMIFLHPFTMALYDLTNLPHTDILVNKYMALFVIILVFLGIVYAISLAYRAAYRYIFEN